MFQATPLLPGDPYESAARFSAGTAGRRTPAPAPAAPGAVRRQVWQRIVALGWPALLIPESLGGIGGKPLDLAAIAEGLGRTAFDLPVISSCGLAPLILTSCPPQPQRNALLAAVVEGTVRVTPALATRSVRASRSGAGWNLDGAITGVETTPDTTHFVVVCDVADEQVPGVFVVPADARGLASVARQRMDGRASADLDIAGLRLDDAAALAVGGGIGDGLARAMDVVSVLCGAEQIGAMGALLEQTIGFLQQRSQFGVVLASLQVLRHDVAELYVAYENARALLQGVLIRWADGESWPAREIAFARLRTPHVSRALALGAIQLHGGIGLTEELPAARLARRLIAAAFDYGGDPAAGRSPAA